MIWVACLSISYIHYCRAERGARAPWATPPPPLIQHWIRRCTKIFYFIKLTLIHGKVEGPCTGHLRFDWLYTPWFSTNLNRTPDPQSRDIRQCTTQFLTWMDHLLDNDTYFCTASSCPSYWTRGPIVEHSKKTRYYDSKHNIYMIEIIIYIYRWSYIPRNG